MASNRDVVQCHIGRRSRKKCGPVNQLEVNRLQTLGELDAPTPNKQIKKISWMILSRIGLNYLVNPLTYSSWTVCLDHRHEFLDYWQVSRSCCHPDHVGSLVGSEMVTLVMSIKILQAESKLLPISGRICISCKERFDDKYGSVAGKKMVIVLPKTQRPIPNASSALSTTFGPLSSLETPVALPSPFIKQEPVDTSREPADAVAEHNFQSSSNVVNAAVPGISLKTEVVEHNSQDLELSENITIKHEAIEVEEEEEEDENEEVVAEVEDDDDALSHYDSGEGATDLSDEESIFSEDSDDDRTWAPSSKSGTGEKRRSSRPVPVKRDFLLKGTPKKKKKTPKPPKEKKIKKPKEPKKKKKPSPPLPKEKADSSEEDKDALIDGGGDNFHYFCKLCQITFYKHSSYKQHVRTNKKTHAEIEAKNKDEEYECTECCIAFMDKKAQIKHMADFHKNPYYCSKCDVQLKSESSFKSHNSKLHLERREKTYYCRECDEIFACKVKQQKHIKTHRLWSGDNPGMQVGARMVHGRTHESKASLNSVIQ